MSKVAVQCRACNNQFLSKPSEKRKYCSRKCYHVSQRMPRIKRECANCGKPFEASANTVRKGKGRFCSKACAAMRDSKITVQCQACGTSISKYKNKSNQYKYDFCSKECQSALCVPRTCVQCRKPFRATGYNYTQAKFCSSECRNERDRSKWKYDKGPQVTLVCKQCGNDFAVRRTLKDKQEYCSKKCFHASEKLIRNGEDNGNWKPKVRIQCAHCDKEFETYPSRAGRKRYCSQECLNHKVEVSCLNCKKIMRLQPSRAKDRVYCSRECQLIHQSRRRDEDERTDIEIIVADMLRQLRYKFVEQYPVGFYTCDFYVVNHNLIIEADGVYWHSLPQSKIRDKQKDTYLTRKGFKILRLPGDKIHQDKEWCIQQIRDSIKADRPFKQLSLF